MTTRYCTLLHVTARTVQERSMTTRYCTHSTGAIGDDTLLHAQYRSDRWRHVTARTVQERLMTTRYCTHSTGAIDDDTLLHAQYRSDRWRHVTARTVQERSWCWGRGVVHRKNNFTESLSDLPFIWRTLIMYQQIIATDCTVVRDTVAFVNMSLVRTWCLYCSITYNISEFHRVLQKLVFWNKTKYWLVNSYQRFGGCCA